MGEIGHRSDERTGQLPVYLIHWNAPDWVRSSAASVRASDVPVAVHIVDNGPAEASRRLDVGEATVIRAERNGGYSSGANIALRHWLSGPAPWCVVGSHDLHLAPDALRRLVAAGRDHPRLGILGPEVTTNDAGRPIGRVGVVELRTAVSGTCLLLRRECIEHIGGFDEDFGSYGEDNDLCERAIEAGWQVGRVDGARAHGLGSRSSNRAPVAHGNYVLLRCKRRGMRVGLRLLAGDARRVGSAALDVARSGRPAMPDLRARARELRYSTAAIGAQAWRQPLRRLGLLAPAVPQLPPTGPPSLGGS